MKTLLLVLLTLATLQKTNAQDTIHLVDGGAIAAIIRQVEPSRILYHLYANPEGALFIKNINTIAWIRYKDGSVDSFRKQKETHTGAYVSLYMDPVTGEIKTYTLQEIDSIATRDAIRYYSGHTTGTGIFFSTILATPVTGIIATAAATRTTPQECNLNIPAKPIAENPAYLESYKKHAFEIKRSRAINNLACGIIVYLIGGLVYIVAH